MYRSARPEHSFPSPVPLPPALPLPRSKGTPGGAIGFACCILLAGVGWPAAARAQTLHVPGAIHAQATLSKVESPDRWVFQIGDRETPLASQQLLRWGSWVGIRTQPAVWLNDGSWLCGDVQIEGANISVASDWLKLPPLAFRDVRGMVLTPPATLSRWLELHSQMLSASGEQDLLWLGGGKKLSGIIREPTDEARSDRVIEVDASGQRIELALDQIEAIVFSPALLGPLPPHPNSLQLGLVDGSLLWLTRLAPQVSTVELTSDAGLQIASLDGPRQFCQAVSYLAHEQAAGGKSGAQLLSSLTAASYRHVSDSSLTWELGIDRDLFGRMLHTEQGIFRRGLATHSSSQVAYRWDGSAARLLAEVTLAARPPQASKHLGSVSCQILVARGGQLQTAEQFSLARSPGASARVQLVDVDLSAVKLVVLVTDKSDFGQFGDHVIWLDARIAKSQP